MTIFVLILGLIPSILNNIPGISGNIKQLIADISGSATALLGSGAISQPGANTVLAAWLGVINALKADPALPAASLSALAQLEKIVQAVLTQDAALARSVDWTTLNPITPVA